MSIEETMAELRREEEIKAYRLVVAQLKQAISCAVCPECGDDIADEDWTVNSDEKLVHKECDQ